MSVPIVRVDNYMENKNKSQYDILSKIYILSGWLIGINRLPIIYKTKRIYNIFILGYPLIVNCTLLAFFLTVHQYGLRDIIAVCNFVQYFTCSFGSYFSREQLKKFYDDLFKFDDEIRSEWKLSNSSKSNFLQISFIIISFIVFNILCREVEGMPKLSPELYPILLNHLIEFYYYAHLLSLLELRLRTIRILLLSSFPIPGKDIIIFSEKQFIDDKDVNIINLRNNNYNIEIKKLMQMYKHIIDTYDFLNISIKWQLLAMLATSFSTTLCISYRAALDLISNEYIWESALFDIAVTVFEVSSVFVPCLYCEKIQTEVQLLRASLHTRIFNNVFDKPSRSIAGYFATLTEVRSLSFSVFRMININASLPFKYFGLVASYLVILLQFQKVIRLDD